MIKFTALFLALVMALPLGANETSTNPTDGIDVRGRHIRFDGEITALSVSVLQRVLGILSNQEGVVVLEFSSVGGGVDAGMSLSRTLETLRVPLVCIVDGKAASMAFYILQSCPRRLITRRSILTIHNPRYILEGGINADEVEFRSIAELLRIRGEAMASHYASRMKLTADEIRQRILGKDWTLSAKDSLDVGAVDGVLDTVDDGIRDLRIPLTPVLFQAGR